ncbi:MAG TPA: Spy/CpxP family protein refolding chaperone [Gemmatimonadaceae bacterium]|nr:Spy/CpxP family protein refolding chaperone [Gemmatimonadaceae bacterium]
MKKFAVVAATFAALAVAGVAEAQGTGAPAPHQHRAEGRGPMGRGGPGMMQGMLLKGITLTDAQKAKLDTLREAQRTAMQAQRGQGRPDFAAIREAREKGDTATANRLMAEQRKVMDAHRDAQFAAIRAILTADQQKQFDANVAEMKKHQGDEMGHGMRPDSAHKGPRR